MWIIGVKYDRKCIAHVVNPEEVPRGLKYGFWTFWAGNIKGAEPIMISRAKEIPRGWKNYQPGFRGSEVRYVPEAGYFIDSKPSWKEG